MTIQTDKGETELGEQVSSFIDGEISGDHCDSLINSLCKDKDLKSCLERYQMISDTMRNQLPDSMKRDFAHCVMSAIESEPTILAPASKPAERSAITSTFSKKVAGFAIAASVATLAVIGVQSQYQDEPQQVATMPDNSEFERMTKEKPLTAKVSPAIVPGATSGYSNASASISRQSIPQVSSVRKFDPKLHQYIVNHSQFVSGSGVHDIISHARIVASTQQKASADQVQR